MQQLAAIFFTSDKPHYPFELPKGWKWTTLGEIGEITTGNTPSKDNKEYYGGNIPFFKPTDLEQGIDTKFSNDKLSQLGFESSRKLPANTVLVTCIGATIGKTGLISVEGSCNQQINAIVPTKSIIPYFLYYACVSEYMQNEIKSNASATTLPILNKGNFSKIAFPLPPLEEQKRIVSEIERWMLFVNVVESGKSDLQKIIIQAKSKILDLAIHGKLVPQDPNDEPASELLKRINPKAEITCDNPQYGKLPKGWCETHIGDAFKVTLGQSPDGSSLNSIDGMEFHQGKILFGNKYLRKSSVLTNSPTKIAEADTLLLCVRAPVGVVNITKQRICIGRGLCCLTPTKAINLDYAFYMLTTFQEKFESQSTGSTFKAISGSIIKNEQLWLPPLSEQHRIVAKIEELFVQLDKIEASL